MANFISLLRTALALVAVSLLFLEKSKVYWICFFLTLLIIFMDMLDGYVARKRGEASKLGAVIDILSDRIVENVYWISFVALGWLPLFIPLIVIIRGILTDGLRSLSFQYGHTPFGKNTMMNSRIGKLIVASDASRFLYAFFKAAAFSLLILAHIPGWDVPIREVVAIAASVSVYGAILFCLLRGVPVIIESRRFFN